MRFGALVGLQAEARLLRRAMPRVTIAVSGARREGALKGIEDLRRAGVDALLSFGCAGGLSPDVKVGNVVIPDWVWADGHRIPCTPTLLAPAIDRGVRRQSGGLCHSDVAITRAEHKRQLKEETGCIAVDMESGFVAQSGLPFCVLRVVCDDSGVDLPPAVETIMSNGSISFRALSGSLLAHPSQIPALIKLGVDAAHARTSMARFLREGAVTLKDVR